MESTKQLSSSCPSFFLFFIIYFLFVLFLCKCCILGKRFWYIFILLLRKEQTNERNSTIALFISPVPYASTRHDCLETLTMLWPIFACLVFLTSPSFVHLFVWLLYTLLFDFISIGERVLAVTFFIKTFPFLYTNVKQTGEKKSLYQC